MFRGRKADLLKILFWDGTGLCLFTKRLEQNRFFWPVADEAMGSVMLTSAQLSMLIESIDWRSPERRWRPAETILAAAKKRRYCLSDLVAETV
jgi:transposase